MLCLRAGVCAAGDEVIPAMQEETQDAPAGESESVDNERFALSGYVGLRALHDIQGHGNSASRGSIVAVVKGKLDLDDSTLALQLRPEFARSSQSDDRVAQVHVDELNWEMEITTSAFVFAGRKRIVNGVALGRNPSDFLNLGKPEDRTLADEDRRAEKKGDDLVGVSYFGPTYSLQGAVASAEEGGRRIRAFLQLTGRLDRLTTDYSVIGYYADNPGLGLNLSTAIGDKMTAYAEIAVRKDRDRRKPFRDAQNALAGTTGDRRRWFPDLVIGGQYTSERGQTFTAEYWRNANGYSDSEFSGMERSLLTGQGNVPLAASLIGTPSLRREKMFFRISDMKLKENLQLEATMIFSLDDRSRFLRGALIWDVAEADSIKAGVDRFTGSEFSEYGVNPVDTRLFVIYKRYF
ncbi:MAG: hypothetical protein HOP03_17080 [Lysobacter sp.]|nr:hypothetical protein [Lysobacter sp.]